MSIVGIVIIILAQRVVIQKGVRPILECVKLSERIAGGDLTGHVNILREDEIGILADSLKSMSEKLSIVINNVRGAAKRSRAKG